MVWLPDGEKLFMIGLFVLKEFTNVTDTQTPHDDIGRVAKTDRRQTELRCQ